jgi:hypothetical protein
VEQHTTLLTLARSLSMMKVMALEHSAFSSVEFKTEGDTAISKSKTKINPKEEQKSDNTVMYRGVRIRR